MSGLLDASLLAVAVSVLLAPIIACDSSAVPASQPSGALAMEFVSELPYPCVNACAMPRRTATSTHVVLGATTRGADAEQRAREVRAVSSDIQVATVLGDSVSCFCDGDKTRPIAAGATCAASSMVCGHVIDVTTGSQGEARIEMRRSDDDAVVDFFPMVVREPVSVIAVLDGAGPKQTRPGRSLVYRGASLKVSADPVDADGERLAHETNAARIASSNAAIVAVSASDETQASAVELGSATLSVSIGHAAESIDVDVVAQ